MKISNLRKIYPYLGNVQKNIHWRNITDAELDFANIELQKIANCYSESVRYALALNPKGRQILKDRIKIENSETLLPAYKIRLNYKGKNEIYRTGKNDYYGKYEDIFNEYTQGFCLVFRDEEKLARLSVGFDIAVSKFIAKHPMAKPILSRLYGNV